MALATTGGKVLIHQPFAGGRVASQGAPQSKAGNDFKFLNTNKDVVALESGCIDSDRGNEVLFIGSRTNLLAYDVENNSDMFDYEVTDGLNCLTFGRIPGIFDPLIIAGGNCSIVGIDKNAEERFWTVTGDNAQALCLADWDEDGQEELIAGSDDFAIRVFKGEELIFDINESAKIRSLQRIHKNIFGYSLENGSFGVYYSRKRLWQQKQQSKVTSIVGMDFDMDGQMELVTGFENGLIDVRKHRTGELIHSQKMGTAAISKLFYYDYR